MSEIICAKTSVPVGAVSVNRLLNYVIIKCCILEYSKAGSFIVSSQNALLFRCIIFTDRSSPTDDDEKAKQNICASFN